MKNVAFFLIPKKDVIFLKKNATMRQALERMEYHGYAAIPLVDSKGHYAGTVTEGDLLWKLKNTPDLTFGNTEKIHLDEIEQRTQNAPVSINAQINDLISRAIQQNFVPVIDDQGIFIGIVRRREIIEYCAKLLNVNADNLRII
ncbi:MULTISPECIES: CBS domain-containing protein [unclassified Dehalobacter]|jgi:CBS domain-containing protein|uniref:CBS domain-containing protein n=1 Tax=unclassified Dehalobacter TaxID=2635733 RepID=UPI00036455E1|nr:MULTISPECIES: CBS domain-containing protein [unclassified Dehalobacter]RJE46914.1 inosine-5-monophosphate dehydrogenase [Dehalobacter sp. MCB1]TCX50838.1 CBS domain-containing protein [Dehalobacter sp. 12DCB1]TCX51549.1 CBS domain-containing protein [Dehalobacter sp. 14DCB1]